MSLAMSSLDFHRATLDQRGSLAFPRESVLDILKKLSALPGV